MMYQLLRAKHTRLFHYKFCKMKISLVFLFVIAMSYHSIAQKAKAAFYSGVYRNVFAEAGYSKKDIDAKVDKAYYDLFEGPRKVYFEVGDSMAYVSDIKNHDARTEGLSYGLMIAVQPVSYTHLRAHETD